MGDDRPPEAPAAASAAAPGADSGAIAGDQGLSDSGTPAEALSDAEYELQFGLVFLEAYHSERAAYFRRANKAGAFVTALSGTTAVGGALGAYPTVAAAAGFLVTVVGLSELILDLGGMAHKHERRVERVKALRGQLARSDKSEAALAEINACKDELEPVEAGQYCAVNAIAWNTAYLGLSRKLNSDNLIIVPWHASALRHVRRFTPDRFCTRAEEQAAANRAGAPSD